MVNNSGNYDDVKKIILALLISRKESISLETLTKDYLEQEGKRIPWKELGYVSLLHYMKSMPHYVSLEKKNGIYHARGIASDKSRHVSSLVARQRTQLRLQSCSRKCSSNRYYPNTNSIKPKSISRVHIPPDILSDLILIIKQSPSGINKDYALKLINSKLPYLNLSVTDLEKQVRSLSHEIYIDGHKICPVKRMQISDQPCSSNSLLNVENLNLRSNNSVESKYIVSGDTESEKSDDDVTLKKLSKSNSKDNINQISNKKQSISTFIQETTSKFHKKEGHMQHYSSKNNYTKDTPLEKLHEEDIAFFNKENIKLLISDKKRYQLEKLIQKYPNGIWCAELPEKYRDEYNVTLNYIELGFNSVREFASYLPEIFQCSKHPQSVDYILYDAKMKLTDINKNNETSLSSKVGESTQPYLEENEVEAVPIVVSSHTSNILIPKDIMPLGESVGQIYVKDLLNRSRQYIEVLVEEVFTPSLFWVQLRKQKKCLSILMDDLNNFYEEKYLDYKIPTVVLEKGLNCACKYSNIWHRGIIQSIRYDQHVTVMFYDYGTLKTYPPEEIFYLHQAFSYLPAQAIPCGLYNIKPSVGERWSRGVTYQFAEETYQRPLIATIMSANPENNSMSVTLTDTMGENDVHINDWMVHKNLAVYGQMDNMVDTSNLMLFVEENLLYDVDKCYDKDYPIPNPENDKTRTKYLINAPLISPHSILQQQSSEILFKSSLCDGFTELPQEDLDNNDDSNELLQKNSSNNPFLNIHIDECNSREDVQGNIKVPSNNPFLEIINKQTKCTNTLSSQVFMQILKTNQKFQKQILSIFSFLIVKLDSHFVKDNDHSSKSELKESYEERLLHASEFLENIILKEDISLLTSKPTNSFNNIKMDFIPDQSNGMSMSLFENNNNKNVVTGQSKINENNIALNCKPQVRCIQSTFTDQDKSDIINSSQEKSTMIELKTETSAYPCQNDFKDIKKDQFIIFDSVLKEDITYNEFNETNPFKVLLKLKERKNLRAAQVEDEKLNFEKYSSDCTNFERDHIVMNNTHDHGSTKQCNDYISSTPKFKYDSFQPEFLSTGNNDPFILSTRKEDMTRQFEDRFLGNLNTRRKSYVKQEYELSYMNLDIPLYSEIDHFQSSNTYSTPLRDNKTEQLINPGFSLPLDNLLTLDKFRFDKTNAMSNSQIYPNMLNERGIKQSEVSSQELVNTSTESLLGNIGKAILSQVAIPNESLVDKLPMESLEILNTNQQFQSTVAYPNYEEKIKNLDSKFTSLPYRKYTNNDEINVDYVIENNMGSQSYNEIFPIDTLSIEEINVPWYHSLELIRTDKGLTEFSFRTIEVHGKKLCIFYLEDQGWLLFNDFIEEFTNYKTALEIYNEMHDNRFVYHFKEIFRSESPSVFFHLDNILSNVLRDKMNKIFSIHLISLKSIIKITQEHINKKITPFQRDPIKINKALTLIRYYRQLENFIK